MNSKNRSKVLVIAQTKVCETYPDTRNFINERLAEIRRYKNLQVNQVFSVCFTFFCNCVYL